MHVTSDHPETTSFRNRLNAAGWSFAVSYGLILIFMILIPDITLDPLRICFLVFTVTLINLAEVWIGAPIIQKTGPFGTVDFTEVPPRKRLALHVLNGLHWTVLLAGVFTAQDPSSLSFWLICGAGYTVAIGAYWEWNTRRAQPQR